MGTDSISAPHKNFVHEEAAEPQPVEEWNKIASASVPPETPGPLRYLCSSPDLSSLSYSELVEDMDQIQEWLGRQTASSFESTHLEESLIQVRDEVARRNRAVSAKTIKPPRPAARGEAAKARTGLTSCEDGMPRALLERSSIVFEDAAGRRQEYDRIISWLQRSDLSKEDRCVLRDELSALAPQFQKDREQSAQSRRTAALSKALGITAPNGRLQLIETMRRIDSIRPLQERQGYSYLLDGSETHVLSNEAVAGLRANVLKSLDQAANRARNMNEATSSDGQDFHKLIYEDQKYAGFAVSVVSGEEPDEMWDPILDLIQKSKMELNSYRNLRSRGQVALADAATHVLGAVDLAQQARSDFDAGRNRAVEAAAGKIVTGLEITRDLAFSVDLALGAALAAPAVAAGVGGVGVTGLGASALTVAGTGGAVGAEGVVLGAGSTALAGGSWQDVKSSAAKWGKRGVAIGAGAGITQAAGSALNAGAAGLSTASNIARVTAAQTAGNVAGNVIGSILEGRDAKDTALSGLAGLGTGLVAGPLGSAASTIENPILKAGANMAIGGATGYVATYALTGDKDEALLSAAAGAGTALPASFVQVPAGPTWGQRTAFNAGRQVNGLARGGLNTVRNALAADVIGASEPVPASRGAPNIPAEQLISAEQFRAAVAPEEVTPVPQAPAEAAAIESALVEDASCQTSSPPPRGEEEREAAPKGGGFARPANLRPPRTGSPAGGQGGPARMAAAPQAGPVLKDSPKTQLTDFEKQTAGTGGISSITKGPNFESGYSITIEGEIKDPMFRDNGPPPPGKIKAPNYNSKSALISPREMGLNSEDWQHSHLWGPGFGDEAAAGLVLAPAEMNQAFQNKGVEGLIREMYEQVKPLGGKVKVKATMTTWELPAPSGWKPTGLQGEFLKEAVYEVRIELPGGRAEEYHISIETAPPPSPRVLSAEVTKNVPMPR